MSKTLMQLLVESKNEGRKQLGILLDPDKTDIKNVDTLVQTIEKAGADIILVGGSLLTSNHFNEMIASIKRFTTLPVVLFPSSIYQISKDADAIMFLSLKSRKIFFSGCCMEYLTTLRIRFPASFLSER